MDTVTTADPRRVEADDGYDRFAAAARDRLGGRTGPPFETDADPDALWRAYLDGFPAGRRQHYDCRCCERFVKRYGGLARIDPATGALESAVWPGVPDAPPLFAEFATVVANTTRRAKVTGVFVAAEPVLGTPATPDKNRGLTWAHLSAPNPRPYRRGNAAAGHRAAELKEDYGVLQRGLAEYGPEVVAAALRVLKGEAVYRSEKALAVVGWLFNLHAAVSGRRSVSRDRRDNLVWLAVASAPPGFAHVKNTVAATLMDDLAAGLPFEDVKRRWAAKLHPLAYQRPTAAPTGGQVDAAEKLVGRLGVAPAFARRYARLADVLAFEWRPRPGPDEKAAAGGVFGHLKPKAAGPIAVDLPEQKITWEKFRRTVLPDAVSMEVRTPGPYAFGPFFGLLTAADPLAPSILQWDGLTSTLTESHKFPGDDVVYPGETTRVPLPRNPVSWYFHSGGSTAANWGLPAGAWVPVAAVFLGPHRWQDPGRFDHVGDHAFFAVSGAIESTSRSSCLFPEMLKAELRPARAVIEAHSNRTTPAGAEAGDANGLAFSKCGRDALAVRVRTAGGTAVYRIDRWD